MLVWASLGRALSLGAIPILWLVGVLHIWILVVALLLFGAFSVFGFAATQSLLPRLVPRARLVPANARLDQTDAAAATLGPAIGGGLVGLLGAPAAITVDAISYLIDAALNAGIRVDEPRPDSRTRNLRAEIRDGLRWTYRDCTLGPLAVSTHVWFLANGAAMTVLSLLALRSLGFTAYTFGLLLTVFGITSLIGASIAPRCGARLGSGRVIILARVAYPIVWLLVAIAPSTTIGKALLFVALSLQGLAAGIENSNEMGWWQALTPDGLLGRVNATRRSVNRTMAALGALVAGLVVGLIGDRPTLIGVIIVFAAAALTAALSPLREAANQDSIKAEAPSPSSRGASPAGDQSRADSLARLDIVPDAIFADPRLARIYDLWEGDRVDLPHYLAIATELGVHSVLDVGCGTGNWACMLAERGFEVTGLDPAAASLDVARTKPGAQRVRWIHGDVTSLPTLAVDLATMTGNVSNVFLTGEEWLATLDGVHAALRPGGYLVFESVDPAGRPWLGWNRETTYTRRESPDQGAFESWTEVTGVDGDLVSIRRTYVFAADGATLTSEGTRRYPPRAAIEDSLISAGYELADVRDAPDRPGRELVFIARKPATT